MARPDSLDPAKVAQYVEYLEEMTTQDFTDELADNLKDAVDWSNVKDGEDPPADLMPYATVVYKERAFRSEALAFKSLTACRSLQGQIRLQLARDAARKPRWAHNAKLFENTVLREKRLLEHVVDGIRARTGVMPSSPNPRARAMERLKESDCAACGVHLSPQFLDILRDEQEKATERKRVQREAMRAKAGRKPRVPNGRPGQRPGGRPPTT